MQSSRILLLILPWVSACYTYQPISGVDPMEGRYVSAELTESGSAQLGRLLGLGVRTLEGNLTSLSEDTVGISVRVARQGNGIESFWTGERVVLPRQAVARISERKLSKGRTTALVVGAIASIAAVWKGLDGYGGNPTRGDGQPGPR